jgi:phosphoglucosamine mutase
MKTTLFGTDGIRANVGTFPLDEQTLPLLGKALGTWIITKYGTSATVLLAHDTRLSSDWLKTTLLSGLLQYPVHITDAYVLPTPAVFNLIHQSSYYNAGIVISASHNPYHDNGIKIMDARTGKITDEDQDHITHLLTSPRSSILFGTYTLWPEASRRYNDALMKAFEPHFLQGKKIVLDCANGATATIAPTLFKAYGAQVIGINTTPNGANINDSCGATYVAPLQRTVLAHQADIGFAFDGDGDRVIAVSRDGTVKNGDDLLALLSHHPAYTHAPTIVSTIMANQGLEAYLQEHGKMLLRTSVGDKYVTEKLLSLQLPLGGEQSGHIILRDYLLMGDGIFAALRIAQTLIYLNNWSMHTFTKYPQFLINIPITKRVDLTASPYAELIEENQQLIAPGRLVIRYSGTEPLLRIMAEALHEHQAQRIVTTLSEKLIQLLT